MSSILKELVANSDLPKFRKNVTLGFIERAELNELKRKEDKSLIEQLDNYAKISDILLSLDDVKIYTVSEKLDIDNKCLYRVVFVNKKGNWERSNYVSPNFDIALLVYLEEKYLGSGSGFSGYAMKMLDIKIED